MLNQNSSSIKTYHRIQEILGNFRGTEFLEKSFSNLIRVQKMTEITKSWANIK